MRIVQVAPYFAPHAGGVESHVRAISREFVRKGHEVTVVTSRYDKGLPEEETIDGIRVRRDRALAVWFNTPVDPAVRSVLDSTDGEVVHLHYPPPLTSYFATHGRGLRGRPLCLTYHCDLYLPTPFGALLTGLYDRMFLPGTLRRANRIVVHTRSYALTSRALRDRPIEIIPSSVDLDRFRPEVDGHEVRDRLKLDGRRVVSFAGRLVPHKGVDTILRAVALLPPDVVLLVIGRGPDLASLSELARRLGLTDRVRFCPQVSDADLPSYLRASDLFVFPSQNRLEGFGLAVAEALACGLPVVVADIPGVREVIEPGREGLLAEPLLEGSLAEKIRELLDDPARRAQMAKAARARAEERYGVGTVTDSLLALYQRLIAAG